MSDGEARAEGPPQDAPASAIPRRLLALSLLRSAMTAAMLVVLYYLAPLDGQVDAGTAVALAAGLLVFLAVVAVQVRAIARSDRPRLRAVEGLAASVPLFLVLFSAVYYLLARATEYAFTEPLSRTDALYFTVTVFATVGFGDIAPTTGAARVATTIQMLSDLLVVGVIVRVLLSAVQVGLRQRGRARRPPGPDKGPAGG